MLDNGYTGGRVSPAYARDERFPPIYQDMLYLQSETVQMLCRAAPAIIVWIITLSAVYFFLFDATLLFVVGLAVTAFNIQYALVLALFGWKGLNTLREYVKTNWKTLYTVASTSNVSIMIGDVNGTDPDIKVDKYDDDNAVQYVNAPPNGLRWEDVLHYVFLPNYAEPESILSSTLTALSQCNLAKTHITVVLCMEEREVGCIAKAERLIAKHAHCFRAITYTVHPKDTPNEIPGKGSNDNYAVKQIASEMDPRTKTRVIVTVADADSILHESYFEALTAKFLLYDEFERHNRVYQPIITPYRNLENVPVITRVAAMVSGLVELAGMSDPRDHHMSYSTYSASLRFIEVYDAWDPTVVSEDNHIYVQSFFMSGGKTVVDPIFLPVYTTCVESVSWWSSFWERFTQAKRHSFGICEFTYCLRQIYAHYKQYNLRSLPITRVITLLYRIGAPHFTPPLQIVYMIFPVLFGWIYGQDNEYVSPKLIQLFGTMQTWTVLAYFICFSVNFKQLTEVMPEKQMGLFKFIWYYLEWVVLGPFTNFWIAGVPSYIAVHNLIKSEKYAFIRSAKPDMEMNITQSHKGRHEQ